MDKIKIIAFKIISIIFEWKGKNSFSVKDLDIDNLSYSITVDVYDFLISSGWIKGYYSPFTLELTVKQIFPNNIDFMEIKDLRSKVEKSN